MYIFLYIVIRYTQKEMNYFTYLMNKYTLKL